MSVGSNVCNHWVLSALSVKMQCCCFRSAASACSGFQVTALVQLKLLCRGLITSFQLNTETSHAIFLDASVSLP